MSNQVAPLANREAYLIAAVELLEPLFERAGALIPPVRVSTGWPLSRGLAAKRKVLGEAWSKDCASDSRAQIFISPWLEHPLHITPGVTSLDGDGMGVLPTLVHELVHASVGHEAGHGPEFKAVATALGLEGKMTSTNAGRELLERLESISAQLGTYPHARIDKTKSGKKKQGTRMIKAECSDCGYAVRTTKKWLEVGAPICPLHRERGMKFELPEDEESTGDEE